MKKFFSENKNNLWFWAFVAIAAILLFAMPLMSKSAGNSGDEDGFQIPQGNFVLNYYKTDGADTTCLQDMVEIDGNKQSWNLKYYGCSFDVLTAWFNDTFGINDIAKSRHIFNSLCGWLIILFGGLIAWRLGGWKAGVFAMLLLFLGTGIRVSECVGLDVDDLDFDMNAFLVTRKGGDQSILYFPDQVADALRTYLTERAQIQPLEGHENALFLSMQKRRMTQRAVENMVKKYALVAAPLKKRISPHKLRSTFGTNLYQETGDIYLVADVLGHADVNTTRRHYAAMSDLNKRKASRMVPLPSTDTDDQD